MTLEVPDEAREEIESVIHSDESPVGIDAKRTHVLILYKLQQIERRLRQLEEASTKKVAI